MLVSARGTLPSLRKLHCDITGSFGIGTSLTNDFRSLTKEEKSKALNMVIKLVEVNGEPCIKISDELTKVSIPKFYLSLPPSLSLAPGV